MAETRRKNEENATSSAEINGDDGARIQENVATSAAESDDSTAVPFSHYQVRPIDRDPRVAPFVCGRLARRVLAHKWLHTFAFWLGRAVSKGIHRNRLKQACQSWEILAGYSRLKAGAVRPGDAENLKRLTNTESDPQIEWEIDEWMAGDHEAGDDAKIYRAMKYSHFEHSVVEAAQNSIFELPEDQAKFALGYILEDGVCRYNSPAVIAERCGGKAVSVRPRDLNINSVVTPDHVWVTDVRQLILAVDYLQADWLESALQDFENACEHARLEGIGKQSSVVEKVHQIAWSRFKAQSDRAGQGSLPLLTEPTNGPDLVCGPATWSSKLALDLDQSRLFWAGAAEPFAKIDSATYVTYLKVLISNNSGSCKFKALMSQTNTDKSTTVGRQIRYLNRLIKPIGVWIRTRHKKEPKKAMAYLNLYATKSASNG